MFSRSMHEMSAKQDIVQFPWRKILYSLGKGKQIPTRHLRGRSLYKVDNPITIHQKKKEIKNQEVEQT